MTILTRFGRRLPVPSTRQIRHELVTFAVREEARLKAVADKRTAEAETAKPTEAPH